MSLLPNEVQCLQGHYRSGRDSLRAQFFEPCLRNCTYYKRGAGYFTSGALLSWAAFIERRILGSNIRIQLLVSPHIDDATRYALLASSDKAERHRLLQLRVDRLLADAVALTSSSDASARSELLAWMIASGGLEIRFAFAGNLDAETLYHEKLGVFGFLGDHRVAFTGSANETVGGHESNYESIDVFRSWVAEDQERVRVKEVQFDEAWNGDAPGLRVLRPSAEILESIHQIAGGVPRPHIATPDDRWRHQSQAIECFMARERGVLEMATGTGKTRTALEIVERLWASGLVDSAIISADGTDLLDQWYEQVIRSEVAPQVRVLRHYGTYHDVESYRAGPQYAVLLCSRAKSATALRALNPEQASKTILIHDEVHQLGSPGHRAALGDLSAYVRYRLGLSATPEREYDAEGTTFIEQHVGPVIFEFGLADAIRRGILCPFSYHALEYDLLDEDRAQLQEVYKREAAAKAAGAPWTETQRYIELSKVYKTSRGKLEPFREFLSAHPEILERSLIFVETSEYGREVLEIVHPYNHLFHTYFSGEEQHILKRFARGDLQCLVTCHRLSAGIDIHAINSVVLFSSARAKLETIQRMGRSLRVNPLDPNKRPHIVDFVRSDAKPDSADVERRDWLMNLSSLEPEPFE